MSNDNDQYDDGQVLVAGVLYDEETGEEVGLEVEDVIACTIAGDDEVTDEAMGLARRIIADLEETGFSIDDDAVVIAADQIEARILAIIERAEYAGSQRALAGVTRGKALRASRTEQAEVSAKVARIDARTLAEELAR